MPLFQLEKLLYSLLVPGLAEIMSDLDSYLSDIFDVDLLGQAYLDAFGAYLTAHPVNVSQGYLQDPNQIPAWIILPATVESPEGVIGGYVNDHACDLENYTVVENYGRFCRHTGSVVTVADSADTVLCLEAVCRYILGGAGGGFADHNFHEVEITARDVDPASVNLSGALYTRSTIVGGKGMDTWSRKLPLVREVRTFGKFSDSEDHEEI